MQGPDVPLEISIVLRSETSASYETAIAGVDFAAFKVCFSLDHEGSVNPDDVWSTKYDDSACTSIVALQQQQIVLEKLIPGIRRVDVNVLTDSQLRGCKIHGSHCTNNHPQIRTEEAVSVFTVRQDANDFDILGFTSSTATVMERMELQMLHGLSPSAQQKLYMQFKEQEEQSMMQKPAEVSTKRMRAYFFDQIYKYQVWSSRGSLGADSGPGSNRDAAKHIFEALQVAPCGI